MKGTHNFIGFSSGAASFLVPSITQCVWIVCSGEGRMVRTCFPEVIGSDTPLKYIILWVCCLWFWFCFILCAKNELKLPFQHIESSFCVLYLLWVIAHTIHVMAMCWVAYLHDVTDWHSRCAQPELKISVWCSWYRTSLMYSFKYNQQDAKLYNILYCCQCSTCFRRFFRPSSGA